MFNNQAKYCSPFSTSNLVSYMLIKSRHFRWAYHILLHKISHTSCVLFFFWFPCAGSRERAHLLFLRGKIVYGITTTIISQWINFNQLYINHYFESPLAIYVVVCWLLSSKIQLISSSTSFPQTISPDLFVRIFWQSQHFVEKKKRWKSLGARSAEYVGWNRTDQSKSHIFFLHDSCWM